MVMDRKDPVAGSSLLRSSSARDVKKSHALALLRSSSQPTIPIADIFERSEAVCLGRKNVFVITQNRDEVPSRPFDVAPSFLSTQVWPPIEVPTESEPTSRRNEGIEIDGNRENLDAHIGQMESSEVTTGREPISPGDLTIEIGDDGPPNVESRVDQWQWEDSQAARRRYLSAPSRSPILLTRMWASLKSAFFYTLLPLYHFIRMFLPEKWRNHLLRTDFRVYGDNEARDFLTGRGNYWKRLGKEAALLLLAVPFAALGLTRKCFNLVLGHPLSQLLFGQAIDGAPYAESDADLEETLKDLGVKKEYIDFWRNASESARHDVLNFISKATGKSTENKDFLRGGELKVRVSNLLERSARSPLFFNYLCGEAGEGAATCTDRPLISLIRMEIAAIGLDAYANNGMNSIEFKAAEHCARLFETLIRIAVETSVGDQVENILSAYKVMAKENSNFPRPLRMNHSSTLNSQALEELVRSASEAANDSNLGHWLPYVAIADDQLAATRSTRITLLNELDQLFKDVDTTDYNPENYNERTKNYYKKLAEYETIYSVKIGVKARQVGQEAIAVHIDPRLENPVSRV